MTNSLTASRVCFRRVNVSVRKHVFNTRAWQLVSPSYFTIPTNGGRKCDEGFRRSQSSG
jgi:hypothetical protein